MSDPIRDELKQISEVYHATIKKMCSILDSIENGSLNLKTGNAKLIEIDKSMRPFDKRVNQLSKLLKTK